MLLLPQPKTKQKQKRFPYYITYCCVWVFTVYLTLESRATYLLVTWRRKLDFHDHQRQDYC